MSKVLIISPHVNRTDFIEFQYHTFKKYLKDNYEFIVLNDAKTFADKTNFADNKLSQKIDNICKKLNIKCIRVPQNIHSDNHPTARCIDSLNFGYKTLCHNYKGFVLMLDSDMFLMKNFSIANYMQNYDISGVSQSKGGHGKPIIRYLWIALLFMNLNTMKDHKTLSFDGGIIDGVEVDAGGHIYHYLKNHPKLRKKDIGILSSGSCNKHKITKLKGTLINDEFKQYFLKEYDVLHKFNIEKNIGEVLLNTFYHYRAGSNWDYKSKELHDARSQVFRKHFL